MAPWKNCPPNQTKPNQTKTLPEFLKEVADFILTKYGPALYLGNQLSAEQKQVMAGKMAEYIGLDAQYIRGAHLLRVSSSALP